MNNWVSMLAVVLALLFMVGPAKSQERMETVRFHWDRSSSAPHPRPIANDEAIRAKGMFARRIIVTGFDPVDIVVRGRNIRQEDHRWLWKDHQCHYENEEGWLVTLRWSRGLCQSVLSQMALSVSVKEGEWVRLTAGRLVMNVFTWVGARRKCEVGIVGGYGVAWFGLFSDDSAYRVPPESCQPFYEALTVWR